MVNLVEKHRKTNLWQEQIDCGVRVGFGLNKDQVIESFVHFIDEKITTILTPVKDFEENEGYDVEAESAVEIFPVGLSMELIHSDEGLNVSRLSNGAVIVTTLDGMAIF